ncbi:MAG: hypothetical protein AAGN35_20650 [Bacteroidota bacterium]
MRNKSFIIQLALIAFLTGMTVACEHNEEAVFASATPVFEVNDPVDCVEELNNKYSFKMAFFGTPTINPETYTLNFYDLNLPFTLQDDCECRVLKHEFEFVSLPTNNNDISVEDLAGNNVSFTVGTTTAGTPVIKIGPYDLENTYIIEFYPTQNPKPSSHELLSASGLCMIDNLDGPSLPPETFAVIYESSEFNPVTLQHYNAIYLPIQATSWASQP